MMRNIIKYCLAFVFFFSAFMKLIDFKNTLFFYSTIMNLPPDIIKILLSLLILAEIILAGVITFDFTRNKTVYYAIVIFLLVFTIASIVFALFGIDNCGCFGTIITDKPVISIIKNVLLLAALYILRKKSIGAQYA